MKYSVLPIRMTHKLVSHTALFPGNTLFFLSESQHNSELQLIITYKNVKINVE